MLSVWELEVVVLHSEGGSLSLYCTESPKQVLVATLTPRLSTKGKRKQKLSAARWYGTYILLY